jgi:hypothetical protein
MTGFERAGWLAWGNIVVFAIVCAVTLVLGIDPSAAM